LAWRGARGAGSRAKGSRAGRGAWMLIDVGGVGCRRSRVAVGVADSVQHCCLCMCGCGLVLPCPRGSPLPATPRALTAVAGVESTVSELELETRETREESGETRDPERVPVTRRERGARRRGGGSRLTPCRARGARLRHEPCPSAHGLGHEGCACGLRHEAETEYGETNWRAVNRTREVCRVRCGSARVPRVRSCVGSRCAAFLF
jgi:hypothetical protein